jgi:cytochrome c biogenesis protein ResB
VHSRRQVTVVFNISWHFSIIISFLISLSICISGLSIKMKSNLPDGTQETDEQCDVKSNNIYNYSGVWYPGENEK